MPYIRESWNIFQDLMYKVPQHPLCVLMLVTRNDHETSQQIAICSFLYIVLTIEKIVKNLDYHK